MEGRARDRPRPGRGRGSEASPTASAPPHHIGSAHRVGSAAAGGQVGRGWDGSVAQCHSVPACGAPAGWECALASLGGGCDARGGRGSGAPCGDRDLLHPGWAEPRGLWSRRTRGGARPWCTCACGGRRPASWGRRFFLGEQTRHAASGGRVGRRAAPRGRARVRTAFCTWPGASAGQLRTSPSACRELEFGDREQRQ